MRSIVMVLLLAGLQSARSQGSFQNLDFESVVPPLVPDAFGNVPVTQAIPGWNAYIAGSPISGIVYNSIAIDNAAISLHGAASAMQPIQGAYSVYLQAARWVAPAADSAIGQTGAIPAATQSLRFIGHFTSLTLSFSGQVIPIVPLGSYSSAYESYGADVSAFAGQTGELRFACPMLASGNTGYAFAFIDSVSFSPSPVPEPSVAGLTLFGFGLLGWIGRKRIRT